ncbi:hypothetical protein [Variovorax guangxiensis]|nr:hypothetical protein [Variovorax guangxiensis]
MRLIPKHQQAGYVTPQARPCCRNCQFMTGEENGLNQVTYWSCRKHGFEVRTGGICPDHPRAASIPGVAAPVRVSRRVGLMAVPADQYPAWGERSQAPASPDWGDSSQAEDSPEWVNAQMAFIRDEEATGSPVLMALAAERRRQLGMEPRA